MNSHAKKSLKQDWISMESLYLSIKKYLTEPNKKDFTESFLAAHNSTPIMPSTDQTWSLLKDHAKHIQSSFDLYTQFTTTPSRFHNHSIVLEDSVSGNSLLFDYSRNLFDDRTLSLLFQLAAQSNVKEWQQKMYSGDIVNVTEGRAAWHVALRDFDFVTGKKGREVAGVVAAELERMRGICELVRSKKWIGSTGKAIRNVVNIGIGGSDLGPAAAYEALRDWTDRNEGCKFYFVSNVDDVQLGDVLKECNAEETLFIVVSKTFTTQETMHNAKLAKDWVLNSVCKNRGDLIEKTSAIERHFIAVSSNTKAATEFGISTKNVLQMWDWVGGRYSVWSAVGISLCIAIGYDNYEQFLKGAEFMDKHFASAPLEKNIPVIMAMLGIWYNNFMDAQSLAVVPYEQRLCRIPAYLQQLEMESNGKSVDKNGKRLSYSTAPIIWGEPGTNGQHAFFQLLHQGTKLIPVDFFIGAQSSSSSLSNSVSESHVMLMANCIAQGEALMKGKPVDVKNGCNNSQENSNSLEMHRFFTGNRPSTTFAYKQLNPFTLGMILAAYEHKVFVQGIVWNVNSFDQFGVELGKSLANTIMRDFTRKVSEHDSSTLGLIQMLQKWGTENAKK